MSMEESISLEETNKIRISLGLKPLTDDKAPADTSDQEAENNYTKKRAEEAKDREAKCVPSIVHLNSITNKNFPTSLTEKFRIE